MKIWTELIKRATNIGEYIPQRDKNKEIIFEDIEKAVKTVKFEEGLEREVEVIEKGFGVKNLTDSEINIEWERMERELRENGETSFSFEYAGKLDDLKNYREKRESEQRKKDKEFAFEEDRAQAQQDEDEINRRNEEENPLE